MGVFANNSGRGKIGEMSGHHQIEMRATCVLEYGDLIWINPAEASCREVAEVGLHVGQRAGFEGVADVADVGSGSTAVDEYSTASEAFIICLAHVGPKASDQIEMLSRAEPGTQDQGLSRHSGG